MAENESQSPFSIFVRVIRLQPDDDGDDDDDVDDSDS